MPRVSEFFGIVIAIYYDDAGQHSLPRRQRRHVQAWARALSLEPPGTIAPLR